MKSLAKLKALLAVESKGLTPKCKREAKAAGAILAAGLSLGVAVFAPGANASIMQLFNASDITLGCLNTFEVNKTDCATFDATTALGLASSWTSGVTPSGVQGLTESQGNEPLAALFAPTTAVGMYFGNDDFSLTFNAILEVFSGVTSLGSVSLAANKNDFADQFIGLSSTIAFDRAELHFQRPEAQGLSVYIDDFRLGAAVPEPGTLALLGLGLAGLAGARRRKLD